MTDAGRRPRTRRWWYLLLGAVLTVAGCTGGSAGPEPTIPDGIAAGQPVELFLGLARDQDGLARFAASVGGSGVSTALPLATVAERFGAEESTRSAVRKAFPSGTLAFSPTGGFARLQLSIEESESRFGVSWAVRTIGDDRVLTATTAPRIPDDLVGAVTQILPRNRVLNLDGTSSPASAASPAPTATASATPTVTAASATATVTDRTACDQAVAAGSRIVADSGLADVQAAGFRGAGARVALVSLTSFDQRAFDQWLTCIQHPPIAVHQLRTMGTDESAPAGSEESLDLAALTLALPDLQSVTVVEAGPADWVGDTLATALTDPAGPPDVISTSIVYCEGQLGRDAIEMTEFVLAAAVAAGTRVVSATGDHGSSACAPGSTAAAVGYPSSSPQVLAVGGVDGSGSVWVEPGGGAASGGGPSAVFPGRVVPDLASFASSAALPPIPVCDSTCRWRQFAGTSFAAPFVAGALVAVDAHRQAQGAPALTFALGSAQHTVDARAVRDVVEGNNDLYAVGCCTAAAGFDPASGWGEPRFDVLAGATS
ncbi:S8 family serine peptidase [Nakamurella sp.]|uniref:S8 family serine peptidase n=1 Tax=Nakamurella sp. TaxID=1869182 RepID=UPI003B3ABF1C